MSGIFLCSFCVLELLLSTSFFLAPLFLYFRGVVISEFKGSFFYDHCLHSLYSAVLLFYCPLFRGLAVYIFRSLVGLLLSLSNLSSSPFWTLFRRLMWKISHETSKDERANQREKREKTAKVKGKKEKPNKAVQKEGGVKGGANTYICFGRYKKHIQNNDNNKFKKNKDKVK